MKRTIAVLLLLAISLSLCACSKELTVEEKLAGTWSKQATNPAESTIWTFEHDEKTAELKGSVGNYNNISESWATQTFFKVVSRTDFTMDLLIDDGTALTLPYAIGKDTLILAGDVYICQDKNIEVNPNLNTYVLDGIPQPIHYLTDYGAKNFIYLGMNQEEVIYFEDRGSLEQQTAKKLKYNVSNTFNNYGYDEVFITYDFDNDKLYQCTISYMEEGGMLKGSFGTLVRGHTDFFGAHSDFEPDLYYMYTTGNMFVEIIKNDINEGQRYEAVTIRYTLQNPQNSQK